EYVADVRNRPFYLSALKTVSDVREAPGRGAGTSWRWTWVGLGMEFEGRGEGLRDEPGKLYSFRTEGGITTTWTYTAEPRGRGTGGQGRRLTIKVECEVAERAKGRLPTGSAAEAMKRTEAERVVQNLKLILDR